MKTSSPYVGPRAYRYGEELFGRDKKARHILRLLLAERIVLLYSPSGAGKTSLLLAKLMPALEAEDFQVLNPARVSGAPPQELADENVNHYVASLIHYWEDRRPKDTPRLDHLSGIDLPSFLTQRIWIRNDPRPKALILDQFEEIITRNPMELSAKEDFFQQLGLSLQNRNRWAIIAMREEHIAGLDPYLDHLPTRLAARYRLDLLNREAARQAIAGPAERIGVSYHPDTLDRLVNELTAVREPGVEVYHTAYVEPLHLQVVCDRLWQRLPDGTTMVRPKLIDTVGTVGEALESYYRGAVHAVAQEDIAREKECDEKRIRDWFEQELISPAGLRDQLQKGNNLTGSLPNPVVEALEGHYLVRSELRRGTVWFEISHDRLVEAIKSENLRWYGEQDEALRLLRNSAEKHKALLEAGQSAHAEAELLKADELAQVENWAAGNPKSLLPVEKSYLEACRNHARKERQSRRLRLFLKIAAAAMSVVLLVAAVVFYIMLQHEEVAKTEARIHRLLADAPLARWRNQDHELSVLLTLQAKRFSDEITPSAGLESRIMDYLRSTLQLEPFTLSPQLSALRRDSWDVGKLCFSPDGQFIAVGSGERAIDLVPLRGDLRDPSWSVLRLGDDLRAVDFSPAGRYLVAVTKAGVELFPVKELLSGQKSGPSIRLGMPSPLSSAVPSGPFCMTADDSLLFIATADGGVFSWRSGMPRFEELQGEHDRVLNATDRSISAMACDAEGRWVATGHGKGAITILTVQAGALLHPVTLVNKFDDWPKEAKEQLRPLKDYLDYEVGALMPGPEGNQLVAVFRHGPVGVILLPDQPNGKPQMVYLHPTRASEAVLKAGAEQGRSSMAHKRIPKLVKAALDQTHGRLVVGSEKFVGEWDLRSLYADPYEINSTELQDTPGHQHLYAPYREIRPCRAPIKALGVLEGGNMLAELDEDLNTRLWLKKGLGATGYFTAPLHLNNEEVPAGSIWTLGFLPDGHTLAVGGSDYLSFPEVEPDTLGISDAAQRLCFMGSFRRMSLSPDAHRLAIVSKNYRKSMTGCQPLPAESTNSVLLMDVTRKTGASSLEEPFAMEVGASEGLWSVSWAKGDWLKGRELLVGGDYNGNVWAWLLDAGKVMPIDRKPQTLSGSRAKNPVRGVALHPTAPFLALGAEDGSLEIYHLDLNDTGRIDARLLKNSKWNAQGPLWALAWSPEGDMLVFGTDSGHVGVVLTSDLSDDSWSVFQMKPAHTMGVTAIAFCSDSRLGTMQGKRQEVCDQNLFASVGNDGRLRLWQIQRGRTKPQVSLKPYRVLEGPKGELLSVAFSPDGKIVAAGDTKGQVHLWRVEEKCIVRDACATLRRNLSCREWLNYVGSNVDYKCTCPEIPPGPDASPGSPCREAAADPH